MYTIYVVRIHYGDSTTSMHRERERNSPVMGFVGTLVLLIGWSRVPYLLAFRMLCEYSTRLQYIYIATPRIIDSVL
jgi:hypothetical protein